MSMDTGLFSREGVNTGDRNEQARRAVRAFRSLQPTLTAYARVLTKRDDVHVEMAARDNGSTDGKRIFYRPPIGLGNATPHERMLCDRRDEFLQPKCPACAIREEVLVTIYHEIDHICFDSFAMTTEEDRMELLGKALADAPSAWAGRVKARIAAAPDHHKNSYIGMAGLINEFLPIIVNALEDARVNAEGFKARKGTKIMFEADTWKTFTQGVEQKDKDGNIVTIMWNKYPLNMQVIVGLFCKASGYDYSDWFVDRVVDALNDEELSSLVKRLDTIRSAAGVYNLSFPVLARLRELGFCQTDTDPDPEPEPEPEPETDESEEQDEEGEPEDSDESGDGESEEPSDGGLPEPSDMEDEVHDDAGDEDPSESEGSGGDADGESEDGGSREAGDPEGSDEADDADDDSHPEADSQDEGGSEEEADDQSVGSTDSEGDDEGPDSDDSPGDSDGSSLDSPVDKSEQDHPAEPDEAVDEDGEPIDTGADDGQGGTEVIEHEEYDDLPMGTPEDAKAALLTWGDHEEKPKTIEEKQDDNAMDQAIIMGLYFETPSRDIKGVREHRWGQDLMVGRHNTSTAWNSANIYGGFSKAQLGIDGEFTPPESTLGPALMRMRVAFADNQRGDYQRNRKTGKINGRVLGKRAIQNDPRLFRKKSLPGKKNYFVLIGMDVSGSTVGRNIALEKEAVFAQAELLSRMGIPFAICAHSGNYTDPSKGRAGGLDLDIYLIKEPHEPWDSKPQLRLTSIGPDAANLDGHTLEYYRKMCDRVQATDKIILYYTDGKMPAENHDEELEILQREIKICKQKGYTLLGVGIRTDSPVRHGLDTVQVDEHADVVKVVRHLEKRLLTP